MPTAKRNVAIVALWRSAPADTRRSCEEVAARNIVAGTVAAFKALRAASASGDNVAQPGPRQFGELVGHDGRQAPPTSQVPIMLPNDVSCVGVQKQFRIEANEVTRRKRAHDAMESKLAAAWSQHIPAGQVGSVDAICGELASSSLQRQSANDECFASQPRVSAWVADLYKKVLIRSRRDAQFLFSTRFTHIRANDFPPLGKVPDDKYNTCIAVGICFCKKGPHPKLRTMHQAYARAMRFLAPPRTALRSKLGTANIVLRLSSDPPSFEFMWHVSYVNISTFVSVHISFQRFGFCGLPAGRAAVLKLMGGPLEFTSIWQVLLRCDHRLAWHINLWDILSSANEHLESFNSVMHAIALTATATTWIVPLRRAGAEGAIHDKEVAVPDDALCDRESSSSNLNVMFLPYQLINSQMSSRWCGGRCRFCLRLFISLCLFVCQSACLLVILSVCLLIFASVCPSARRASGLIWFNAPWQRFRDFPNQVNTMLYYYDTIVFRYSWF